MPIRFSPAELERCSLTMAPGQSCTVTGVLSKDVTGFGGTLCSAGESVPGAETGELAGNPVPDFLHLVEHGRPTAFRGERCGGVQGPT